MRKSKGSPTNEGAKRFLICLGISILNIILFSLVAALIVGAQSDPTKYIGAASLGAMLLSAIMGGVITARINGDTGMRLPCLAGLSVVLIMLLINVIISSGRVSIGAFINYGCYMGTYVLSAYLGRRKDKRHRHR